MEELSLHILDLAQNSIAAGADQVKLTVEEQPSNDTLTITVLDNGCGMSAAQAEQAADPFFTTRHTRSIGLGLPLFKMAAELTGGSFSLHSAKGKGTQIRGVFRLSSIDRMPLGDLNGTLLLLIQCNPSTDFIYTRICGNRNFELDTRRIRRILGEVPINRPEITVFLRKYLKEGDLELKGGVYLDESGRACSNQRQGEK
ncbi:MAG: ATP-binding protein [Oscillospiraceae bacterium]|jgi:hypothetical protein|nr:ATP-binding protein [Oscillospiraceae bacterium]